MIAFFSVASVIIISLFLIYFLLLTAKISKKKTVIEKKHNHGLIENISENVFCIAFDLEKKDDYKYYAKFLDEYFGALVEYCKKAKKQITILDYLAHHKYINQVSETKSDELFIEKYKYYFKELEEFTTSNNIVYRRIMQLPLGTNLPDELVVKKSLDLMFIQTYEHILKLSEKSSRENTDIFQLYILKNAIRPYSYIIIDDEFVISEFDRYKENGQSYPDHLIIDISNNDPNSAASKIIKNQNILLEEVLSDKKPITFEDIKKAKEIPILEPPQFWVEAFERLKKNIFAGELTLFIHSNKYKMSTQIFNFLTEHIEDIRTYTKDELVMRKEEKEEKDFLLEEIMSNSSEEY